MQTQTIEKVNENKAKITSTEVREVTVTLDELKERKKAMEDYIAPQLAQIAKVEAQIQELIRLGVRE